MGLSIQTNVAAMSARRSLASSQLSLDGALSKLSSGYRITRASDDAAGLAISTKLTAKLRSHGQAARNAADGLSVVQAAEAGLDEQASLMQRLRQLAMQSASDGVGDVERRYLDREAGALLDELQRISQVTEFNGRRLLDGSAVTLDFQVGVEATAADVISVLGLDTSPQHPLAATAAVAGQAAANAAFVTSFTSTATGNLAAAQAAANLAALAVVGDPAVAGHLSTGALHLQLLGGAALLAATAGGGTGGNPALAAAYQAFVATMGATGNLATAHAAAAAAGDAAIVGAGVSAANATLSTFRAHLQAAGGAVVGSAVAPGLPRERALAALGGPGSTPGLGLAGFSVATKGAARTALGAVDQALERLSSARAALGATGNRLQSAIDSIRASSEALAAANGRILDVDVAEESSRLSRSQILLQAGVAVLGQAGIVPQLALKLLG